MCGHKIKINEASYQKIKEICASFDNNPGELINVLHKTQEHFGYLPEEVQQVVAEFLGIPPGKVYGVVSFYSFFTMNPKGKYAISVCLGTACYVKGAEKILDALKSELKISEGGVTPDGKFSLDVLRCVGACGLAPVMTINGKTYGRLVPERIKGILAEYAD
ncbi:MAG: NADH-quinone oxidoreductase subunit NuoE [Bacteroidales bacterium]|nr:NADH-quinone oxidoreductase subunit NuoE [Bacteroidales bacterium]